MEADKDAVVYAEIRRPNAGEFALIFEEGGTIYTVPGAKIAILPDGSVVNTLMVDETAQPDPLERRLARIERLLHRLCLAHPEHIDGLELEPLEQP